MRTLDGKTMRRVLARELRIDDVTSSGRITAVDLWDVSYGIVHVTVTSLGTRSGMSFPTDAEFLVYRDDEDTDDACTCGHPDCGAC